MNTTERLKEWANKLDDSEMEQALIAVVARLIEIEEINFYDGSSAPYWDGDGEPVVEGQDCYVD